MESDAFALYRSARRLLEERDAPAAVPLLEQAARQLPDERAILRLLALAHYGSASFTAAEPLLRRLVDDDPLDAESVHMLGKTLELTGRPEQAQQYFALAGHLTPAYAVSCQAWGGQRIPVDATYATIPAEARDSGPFFHGTKAHLKPGDLLEPGYSSNFGERRTANYLYLTATLDAATWGAELAVGEGPGRIYRVEPTGPFEDDPNLTDKKFPGNPTRSYRTREALRVVATVLDWEPHPPEVLQDMRNHLEKLKRLGIEAIND